MIALGILAVLAAARDVAPLGPTEAVALADRHRGYSVQGSYRMKVAATGRHGNTVFLNSSTDYRAPDDLTFEITGSAAKALEKRLGAKADHAFMGKEVVVWGGLQTIPIVEVGIGGNSRFSRYQHRVRVYKADQLSVE